MGALLPASGTHQPGHPFRTGPPLAAGGLGPTYFPVSVQHKFMVRSQVLFYLKKKRHDVRKSWVLSKGGLANTRKTDLSVNDWGKVVRHKQCC